MTDIRVNLNKSTLTANWSTISVKSAKHEGTLAQVNCAILPKKAECSEQAWQALGCLDTVWKAYIRRIKYAKDATRHTKTMDNAIHDFYTISAISPKYMAESTFRDLIIGALNLHYAKSKKTGEGMTVAQCATFKKTVLRTAMRIQQGTFTLMNVVKNEKSEPVNINVKDLSQEQICSLLGIDLDVWERIQKAQAMKSAC